LAGPRPDPRRRPRIARRLPPPLRTPPPRGPVDYKCSNNDYKCSKRYYKCSQIFPRRPIASRRHTDPNRKTFIANRLHRRGCLNGKDQTASMPRLRHDLSPGTPARGSDGQQRRGVRRLPPLCRTLAADREPTGS
jgi:hypothetical protein